ncbi:MAG: hypothetical protein WKG01_04285 [Kofleriaceae bacterium]
MTDQDRRIFKSIKLVARGERVIDGRDHVASGQRLSLAGMQGRALEVSVDQRALGDRRHLTLRAGHGELSIAMQLRGEQLFPYGDLTVSTRDRRHGATFADAMADWLGSPLASRRSDLELTPGIIEGGFVRLGQQRDVDGVEWEVLKLFVGTGDDPAEFFLRLDRAGGRGALTEKWARYRVGLLTVIDGVLGAARELEPRQEVHGVATAWLTVPRDWIATSTDGHVTVTDARCRVVLELSSAAMPLAVGTPGVYERLQTVLALAGHGGTTVHDRDRGDLALAIAELPHGRWLIAASGVGQVLATFHCPDDDGWAIAEWHRIVSTLRIG